MQCTLAQVNQKTRAAAYGLLVELGQAMQDAAPPAMPDLDAHMAGMELQGKRLWLQGPSSDLVTSCEVVCRAVAVVL